MFVTELVGEFALLSKRCIMNGALSELVPMNDLCCQQLINHFSFGNLYISREYEYDLYNQIRTKALQKEIDMT